MIYQNDKNENTQNQFSNALKELKIGKLLRNSNITKSCGVSAYEVFQFLLLLVFQGRNRACSVFPSHPQTIFRMHLHEYLIKQTPFTQKYAAHLTSVF